MKYIVRKLVRLLPAVIAAAMSVACDSIIYDDEGDCAPHYKVRFVYERNLRYVDAFSAEVEEVTLYVVDSSTGKVILRKHESGEALSSGDYMMDVDVPAGTYTLVAWCGPGHTTSFSVGEAVDPTGLTCRLTDRTPTHPVDLGLDGSAVTGDLQRLYHGKLTDAVFPDSQGTHIFTVDLTKNTNDVHIVLQHLSGEPVDESRFTFTVTEQNGLMDWDNSLADDEILTYYPWRQRSGFAGVDVPDYTSPDENTPRAITAVSAAVADITVGRLMADRKAMVRIYNDNKELVASIPLVDYALLVKGRHHQLSDQDYLDYCDDYSLVLFLDNNGRWANQQIYINSWHLVIQNVDGI